MNIRVLAVGILWSLAAHTSYGVGSSYSVSDGDSFHTEALTTYNTLGGGMVGSVVTVRFGDGTSQTATWQAANSSVGFAFGGLWEMYVSGNTLDGTWSLASFSPLAITGFTFNGVPGNTVFDIVNGPSPTPGANLGLPFGSVSDGTGVTFAAAAYTNRLLVGGKFYGDMYTQMDVKFTGSLGEGQTLTFKLDTDSADATKGGILPGVPEPSTFSVMLLGLLLMGAQCALKRRGT